jgi:hypothetical protein
VRVHLISKQALAGAGADPWDERSYVFACGGLGHGNEGHHGEFDALKLDVPRDALPRGVRELAVEFPRLERRLARFT